MHSAGRTDILAPEYKDPLAKEPSEGISMASGKKVNIDLREIPKTAAPKPAAPETVIRKPSGSGTNAYLDSVSNTSADKADMAKAEKKKLTPADRKIIGILGILNLAAVIFIGLFIGFSGGADEYERIREQVNFDPAVNYYNPASGMGSMNTYIKGVAFPSGIQERFKPLYSENSDTAGWIKIPGTSIDFPVMKAPDNDKYLRANFYLKYDRRGSIFMDFRNTFGSGRNSLSKVTILYGHHLTLDECIFADVEKYLDVNYYKAHPVVEMDTIYDDYKWKVFACFLTNADFEDDDGRRFYYWYPEVRDDQVMSYCSECLTRSWFVNPAVDITETDKFLCLSTCSYLLNANGNHYEIRCVLMARLVRPGESEEVNTDGAYKNENRRMPQIYYNQNGIGNPYANVPVWAP